MTTNLPDQMRKLSGALTEMVRVAGKEMPVVMVKQASEFTRDLGAAASILTPAKGSIRFEREAALKTGSGGVKVRPSIRAAVMAKFQVASVRATTKGGRVIASRSGNRFARGKGKRLKLTKTITRQGQSRNLQSLMVEGELNAREKGRGFTAYGARLKTIKELGTTAGSSVDHLGRYHNTLADAALHLAEDQTDVTLRFGGIGSGVQSELGDSLSTRDGQTVVGLAVERRISDMAPYIARKYAQGAAQSLSHVFPTTLT